LTEHKSKGFNRRRIAIFEPHPDFATNPSLVCLSEALTRSGARVDVMMPDNGNYPPVDSRLTRYPYPRNCQLWFGGIRATLRGWRERAELLRTAFLFASGAYDLILGIDNDGIINGYKYAKRFDVPLIYLSLEISFRDELLAIVEIKEKELECTASQFADLVIIQDQWRAKLLADENGLSPEKFEYLPVSPRGSQLVKESDYLRRRFNISENQTIVLHSGSFADWTYADELLDNVSTWPEGFVLVVHTRYKPGNTDKYVQAIQEAKLPNVFLSVEPLPQNEYEQLVASANIGLVLYKPMAYRYALKNIQTIGFSSGKFSVYMKYGLPIISIGQQTYTQLLAGYAFGENLTSFQEIPAALQRVRAKYAHHQAEAQRLFYEKLDFDIHWPRLTARILEVLR